MELQSLFDKGRRVEIRNAINKGTIPELLRKPATDSIQPSASGRIIPLTDAEGKIIRAGYFEAWKLAVERGMKLPSNVLHDDYLLKWPDKWKNTPAFYKAWAREIVAHPEKDGIFAPGKDIVDSETGWILPLSDVVRLVQPSELSGMKKGLFIDPQDIVKDNGRIIVLPASIVILYPFIQSETAMGKADMTTRMPLENSPGLLEKLSWMEIRGFMRIAGVGIRPVAYGDMDTPSGAAIVRTDLGPNLRLGAAIETDKV